MPICGQCNCGKTLVCPEHGKDTGPQYGIVGGSVLACKQKAGIWVRVLYHTGVPAKGVGVSILESASKTGKTGFAVYDDVPPDKEHTAVITLGDLGKTWKMEKYDLTSAVPKGEVKVFSFVLLPKAKPVIAVSKAAVAVDGNPQQIFLSADNPYKGKGIFTCTKGLGKVEFDYNGDKFSDSKTFPNITEDQLTVTVTAKDHSDLNGVEFTWLIDDSDVPDTGRMTAVKAELKVYKKSGPALSEVEKAGDGRTIHQQIPGKKISRAKKMEFFAGGVDASSDKTDTELQLTIDDLSGVVDKCNFTVVLVTLQLCAPRVDADTPPAPMPDDKKFTDGRTLLKQRSKLTGQRAMLRVTKTPLQAPCKLKLSATAGGNKVVYYEAIGTKPHVNMKTGLSEILTYSNEIPIKDVDGKSFPRDIAVDEVKDMTGSGHGVDAFGVDRKHLYQGLVFWLEGAVTGGPQETEIQLDVEDVDVLCDAVSCTVTNVKLTVELKKSGGLPFTDDVDFSLTEAGKDTVIKSGVLPKDTGTLTVELEAGFYGLAIKPKNAMEKKMRIMRTAPADSETSLSLFADMTVQFNLVPPYKKVQCIGYFMRTGAYVGVDSTVTGITDADQLRAQKRLEALKDIHGRCAIMKYAVENAYTATGVEKDDDKVLKIFMAPEFYFRGLQGAYPLETMDEILTPPKNPVKTNIQALKDELDKTQYKDWLFVLGSAIGAIELDGDPQRTVTPGTISKIETNVKCRMKIPTGSPAALVANGWRLYSTNTSRSFPINSVAPGPAGTNWESHNLEFTSDIILSTKLPAAVGSRGFEEVTPFLKVGNLKFSCATPPQINWFVRQGGNNSKILKVVPEGGTVYRVEAQLLFDGKFNVAAAILFDGSNAHPANIIGLYGCHIFVNHSGAGAARYAVAKWRFWIKTGPGDFDVAEIASHAMQTAYVINSTQQVLIFGTILAWNMGDRFAAGDLFPVQMVSEKLVTLEVQLGGPVTVAKGQFFEVGADAKGLVESSTDLSANKYKILVWLPLENAHGLAVTNAVNFTTPGTGEIVNVALVRKGGAGTPIRTDGGAQKELLVYKESISSVDFAGMDYGRPAFSDADRHGIQLYGDPARIAFATEGASNAFSKSRNEPGEMTTGGARITETNRSGLGGGSIFTMDRITFGLEVCLDHLNKKLLRYFKGLPGTPPRPKAAVVGEPEIQVQLIPSCGMSIRDPSKCTVPDGIIFNVDAYSYDCQKAGGGSATTKLHEKPLTPPSASTYFITTHLKAQTGKIEVYEAVDTPTARNVT